MSNRELDHVVRCIFCGTITEATWLIHELDDNGDHRIIESVDEIRHSTRTCAEMAKLYNEELPVSLME